MGLIKFLDWQYPEMYLILITGMGCLYDLCVHTENKWKTKKKRENVIIHYQTFYFAL